MNNATEKIATTTNSGDDLVFRQFPAFAIYILDNHLVAYVQEQLRVSREVNLPLLKFFAHLTEEQLLELGMPGHIEFLTYASKNELKALMENSLRKWREDQLEVISRDAIAAEDITLITYVRKQALLKFLPAYAESIQQAVDIVKEIESYDTASVTASVNLYINMLHERIAEHTHFIENITNTTPGINYVFNIQDTRLVYANKNYEDFFGYTKEEIEAKGPSIFTQMMHADDLATTEMAFRRFDNARDGQVISWEQRLKNYKGEYKWVRNHASVFRRDAAGKPLEIAGIAMDVDIEKRTAEQLLKSEERLLEAQELSDMASYEMDVATERLTVSPNFYKITGLPHGLARKDVFEHIHPGDRMMITERLKKAIENNGMYDYEYRFFKDGNERILWSRGRIDTRDGAKVVIGTLMDVTERRHMIQQLQRSEALYKQAQTLAHIGNWSWFIATNRVFWSDELYDIFDISKTDNITYDKYMSCIHPDDKHILVKALEQVLAEHTPYDIVHRAISANGSIKHIQSKGEAVLDEEGNAFKLIGTAQDITEKFLIEQKLRTNQEFVQKVANTTPSLIASYNVNNGNYTYLNQAFHNILGYELRDIFEKGVAFFIERIHPEDITPLIEKNTQALADANTRVPADGNEPVVEFKYRVKHKNGNYLWFHTYGTIFDRDADGKVAHILNVSVDITDQEEAEQALHRKNVLLQQSNASLEEFAYVASHDLKEPLRKISTFGDRLLTTQYDKMDDAGRVYIDKIIDSSRRMQTMISDLLSLSIISGNKTFIEYDLNEVLRDVLTTLEYKIEEHNVTVKADKLPVANIVVAQFRQLFQNLISNSIKFAKEGVPCEVKITHTYLSSREVKDPSLASAQRYLSISVADNGIGFDNQYTAKIFTIFQRLHSKTDYEGNGIGLAICRKIAENHGGTIYASSTQGIGAIFTIIIPA